MKYRYFICDVFSPRPFSGNQLAVLPEAEGLNEVQMQQIAREFNFSETAFVFPPEQGQTRKVRIFTPTSELPFAGHPNLGTAFSLYLNGYLGEQHDSIRIVFEEKAGLVPIFLRKLDDGLIWCELQAPEKLSIGKTVSAEDLASAISLDSGDIITDIHPPQQASVGLPFVIAELKDRQTLEQANVNIEGFKKLASQYNTRFTHIYIRSNDEFDVRTRMFGPFDGMMEDPATGSANCALGGLLTHYNDSDAGEFEWEIAQGVEMGRPSFLKARTQKKGGEVTATFIGGNSVMVSEGIIIVG